jgi:chromosome segregation protein
MKLAGFKSFVDPVTLRFPDAMTAVLGPNGCGKSNVIDAIRWVMGESSARQLRGDSMSDVIFAGTTHRKPVGQASVELMFENTLGRLGGAYNHYSELSVRRQVTRDGRSDYFLNGTRCRRRDITDIFLGTGLGPRSYAVIQQGMINRLVEAKPDELRVFIEEAAGVSRYQARRRETLEHLAHTRQNLLRLQDVVDELAKQISSLKRQSQAAERFKQLQAEQRVLQIQLWSAEYQQWSSKQQQQTDQLAVFGEQFRDLRGQRNQTELDWQTASQQLTLLLADAEPEQQRWQVAEQEHAKCASMLSQHQQQLANSNARLIELQTQWQRVQTQHQQDQQQSDQLVQALAEVLQREQDLPNEQYLHTELQQQDQAWHRLQASVHSTEQQLQQLQQRHSQLSHEIGLIERNSQRQHAQVNQLQASVQQVRLEDLQAEYDDLQAQRDDDQVDQLRLQAQQQALQQALFAQQQQHDQRQAEWQVLHQQRMDWRAELQALQAVDALSMQHQATQSQIAASLASVDTSITASRLTDQLQLTAEGQQHVELIERLLGHWLNAPIMMESEPVIPMSGPHQLGPMRAVADLNPLADSAVQSISCWISAPMSSLWQAVGIVSASLPDAEWLALRDQLRVGQSLLSLSGVWCGVDWQIDLHQAPMDAGAGQLARRLRVEQRQGQLDASEAQYQQLSQQRQRALDQIGTIDAQLAPINSKESQLQQTLHQHDLQLARLDNALDLRRQQLAQQHAQLAQLLAEQQDDQQQREDLQMELASVQMRLSPLQQQLAEHREQFNDCRQRRDVLKEQHRQMLNQRQQCRLDRQLTEAKHQSMRDTLARGDVQQADILAKMSEIEQKISALNQQLAPLLAQHDHAQMRVLDAREQWALRQNKLAEVQATQQRLSDARQHGQQQEDHLRDQMEHTRLVWQQAKGELLHIEQQLTAIEAAVDLAVLFDAAVQAEQRERLHTVERQLAKLGDLNLAAPAALQELTERHNELCYQMDDLQQTIDQLEAAMTTIDQETRQLFMGTFDRVNAELQVLFPKVFGGGQARLSLEDGWQSGVRLMAQPPGKKNSSIALLSGGEKALTALSLVFAIFRLNPAPFCLLDEVDAPLDDANVQRFCTLVAELSEQVQFIYISHNKLAMSMATDLIGVTMPEAGVSRVVSVSLEQAATFAVTHASTYAATGE